MLYYVLAPDGNKYGPADQDTLRTWLAEGRLQMDTLLEEAGTGNRVSASTVLQAPYPGGAPQQLAAPPTSPYPRTQAQGDGGQTQFVVGWVLAVLSLFFCPIGLGIAAIVLAVMAKNKGHQRATILIVCSIVFMLVGIVIGVVSALSMGMGDLFTR